jgi:hypothetical protein
MAVEALVLDGDEGLRHVGRQRLDLDGRAPLLEQLGDELAVAVEDLRGLLRLPYVDLRDRRAVAADRRHAPGEPGHEPSDTSASAPSSVTPAVRVRAASLAVAREPSRSIFTFRFMSLPAVHRVMPGASLRAPARRARRGSPGCRPGSSRGRARRLHRPAASPRRRPRARSGYPPPRPTARATVPRSRRTSRSRRGTGRGRRIRPFVPRKCREGPPRTDRVYCGSRSSALKGKPVPIRARGSRVDGGDEDPLAVAERAAAATAVHSSPVALFSTTAACSSPSAGDADGDGVHRVAVQVVGRAVERVDDPGPVAAAGDPEVADAAPRSDSASSASRCGRGSARGSAPGCRPRPRGPRA